MSRPPAGAVSCKDLVVAYDIGREDGLAGTQQAKEAAWKAANARKSGKHTPPEPIWQEGDAEAYDASALDYAYAEGAIAGLTEGKQERQRIAIAQQATAQAKARRKRRKRRDVWEDRLRDGKDRL